MLRGNATPDITPKNIVKPYACLTCVLDAKVVTIGAPRKETTMTGLSIKQPVHAPVSAYSAGRHEQWECVHHECEKEHYDKTGQFWTYDYRKKWLERYFSITPHMVAHEIRECGVCAKEVADGMLSGDVGKEATQALRQHIRQLSRKMASKLGARSKRIDAF